MAIRVGLKEVVIAQLLTDVSGGSSTWDTPLALPCAVTASQKAVGAIDKFYGDDGICDVNEVFVGVDLDLQISNLDQETLALLLGHTYSQGGVLKAKGDTSPYFAIGFKVKYSDGTYKYYWLYKCKFKKPDENAETLKESTTWQNYALMATCIPLLSTGAIQYSMTNNDTLYNTTVWTNFFNNVFLPTGDTTAMTATAAVGAGGDAGKVVVTFVKASAASFSLNSATVIAANLMILDTSGTLRAGAYVVSGAGTSVTVKFTPTVAFGVGEDIGVAVTNRIKDNSNVAATPSGDVLTF